MGVRGQQLLNPSNPIIHIQILQTDLHKFPLKIKLREFGKRSQHFPSGDQLINSPNLFFFIIICIDIIRRKLMLATARNTCKISVRAHDQKLANDNRICI